MSRLSDNVALETSLDTMYSFTGLALLAVAALPSVLGHGVVTTPTPRKYASVAQSACGSAVYNVLTSGSYCYGSSITHYVYTQPDLTGPIENAVKKVDSSFDAEGCELYFCRGARVSTLISGCSVRNDDTRCRSKTTLRTHASMLQAMS